MKLRMLSLIIVVAGCALVGCAGGDGDRAVSEREVPLQQRYHIDVVRSLATDLRPGMTKAEVYTLLGAPAEYRGDTWVYRGGVDGGDEFRVRFEGDRYAEHSAG